LHDSLLSTLNDIWWTAVAYYHKMQINYLMGSKLFKSFSELFIIVAGITISLFFDELAEDIKKDKQELYYLQSIVENLEEDSLRLHRANEFIDLIEVSSDILLKHYLEKPSPEIPEVTLINSHTNLLQHTIFAANKSVYEELKSTGAFIVIKNKVLKNTIFNYYGTAENTMENDLSADDVIVNYVYERINDYTQLGKIALVDNSNYAFMFEKVQKDKLVLPDLPQQEGALNNIVNAITIRKGMNVSQQFNYQRLAKKNAELLAMIRKELSAK